MLKTNNTKPATNFDLIAQKHLLLYKETIKIKYDTKYCKR